MNSLLSILTIPAQPAKKQQKNNQHKPGKCGKSGCTQPRHITSSGRVTTYCREHRNAEYRDYYAKKKDEIERNELKKKIPVHKPGKCPKCESPRHRTKSGVVTTYCKEENNQRYMERYSAAQKVNKAKGVSDGRN